MTHIVVNVPEGKDAGGVASGISRRLKAEGFERSRDYPATRTVHGWWGGGFSHGFNVRKDFGWNSRYVQISWRHDRSKDLADNEEMLETIQNALINMGYDVRKES